MKENKILQMFYFLLFNITAIYAKLPETLFGIKVRRLDNEYIRLIFDQALDNNAQKQLSTQLSAVLICLDIESNLVPFDIHASKISKLSKKTNKKYDNIEMRTKFEELIAEIEQKPNNNLGEIDICKLCDFEYLLKKVKHSLDDNISRGTLRLLKGVDFQRSYDCNELKSIGGSGNLPIWWDEFHKQMSATNFNYINAKLALDFGSTQSDIWQWFGPHKIAGESELSHRIRLISARGDVDQINAFKTVMELYILRYGDMKLLEFHNPFTLAADVLTETAFSTLLDAMFGTNSNNCSAPEEECLEFSFVLLKILTYFRQLKDDESVKNKVKIFWKILVKILENKNQMKEEKLQKLYFHLNELKNNFGTLTMPQNYISLARSYEKYFIKLHSKNHFNQMFVERFFLREKIKRIFQIIDEDKQILSKQFWGLFEVDRVSASASSESEIYLPKLYKECPPKLLSEYSGNIDKSDKSAFLIMNVYLQLMAEVEDESSFKLNPAAKEQFENVEITVLLWVYNELIDDELFKFANSIEHNNANFVSTIDAYTVKWDNVWIENRQNDNTKMCCELHKFAIEMVEDETLKQNGRWHMHVKSLVDRSTTTLYEPVT
ncbi:hypothetical protein GPALN_010313 [Globodera pallida]|nr:hypothetical protein GPALN_010313 [Globodera pallida]